MCSHWHDFEANTYFVLFHHHQWCRVLYCELRAICSPSVNVFLFVCFLFNSLIDNFFFFFFFSFFFFFFFFLFFFSSASFFFSPLFFLPLFFWVARHGWLGVKNRFPSFLVLLIKVYFRGCLDKAAARQVPNLVETLHIVVHGVLQASTASPLLFVKSADWWLLIAAWLRTSTEPWYLKGQVQG